MSQVAPMENAEKVPIFLAPWISGGLTSICQLCVPPPHLSHWIFTLYVNLVVIMYYLVGTCIKQTFFLSKCSQYLSDWMILYNFYKWSSWPLPHEGKDKDGENHLQDETLRIQTLGLVVSFVCGSCLSELWWHAVLLYPSSVIFPESSGGSSVCNGPHRSRSKGMLGKSCGN